MRPLVAAHLGLKAEGEDDEEPELPTGGFSSFSIEYMNQTGQNLIFHHILPDEGGWNDQDAEWSDAFFNWVAYWRYLEQELQPEVELQRQQRTSEGSDPLDKWLGRHRDDIGDLL